MAEDNYVQLIANYRDWIAIKKLKITEQTDPKTVMEFLAGLTTSIDRKVEENLKKTVELSKLDLVLNEILSEAGKKEEEISKILAEAKGAKINKAINEICIKEQFEKKVQKELIDFCKVYAMKKALKACSLNIDYSNIEIPGMKRLQKKQA